MRRKYVRTDTKKELGYKWCGVSRPICSPFDIDVCDPMNDEGSFLENELVCMITSTMMMTVMLTYGGGQQGWFICFYYYYFSFALLLSSHHINFYSTEPLLASVYLTLTRSITRVLLLKENCFNLFYCERNSDLNFYSSRLNLWNTAYLYDNIWL